MPTSSLDPIALERTLRALAAETLSVDPESLAAHTRFEELGADSLSLVELGMAIEDAFGFDIPKEDYGTLHTLGDALRYVQARLAGTSVVAPAAVSPTRTSAEAASEPARITKSVAAPPAPVPRRRTRSDAERVVITGMGAITPLGLDAPSTFAAMLRGESGIGPVSFALHPEFGVRIAAEVKGFEAATLLGAKDTRRHGRFTHLACAAALEATRDAALEDAGYAPERIATLLGVGMGGVELFYENAEVMLREGPRRVSPFALAGLVPNMAPGVVSRLVGAKGPSYSLASACASSAHALASALDLLRAGRADVVLAGGAEAGVTPIGLAGFARMAALSTRNDEPTRASRPFDRDRDGFVMGEGAGVLVLETLERARARGARIYAELAGAGASSDAFHETQPDPDGRGEEAAVRLALEDAGVVPEQVGYVNAHATSTPVGDRVEARMLRRVFGEGGRRLCVSSTKSMTGHLLGAAGAVEAIATVLALGQGMVPPTLNVDHLDPECDVDCVPNHARAVTFDVAVSNNFGFGGHNASLVFRRV